MPGLFATPAPCHTAATVALALFFALLLEARTRKGSIIVTEVKLVSLPGLLFRTCKRKQLFRGQYESGRVTQNSSEVLQGRLNGRTRF
jgi:hypothetical protein